MGIAPDIPTYVGGFPAIVVWYGIESIGGRAVQVPKKRSSQKAVVRWRLMLLSRECIRT
jgi:hypothetical protein